MRKTLGAYIKAKDDGSGWSVLRYIDNVKWLGKDRAVIIDV